MHRRQSFDRLDLNDQIARDDKIGPKRKIDPSTIVLGRDRRLPGEWNASIFQFGTKKCLIHGLKQPRPEPAMDIDCQANNASSQPVVDHTKNLPEKPHDPELPGRS
jgi:hypothetical protein